jgi:small subunit ribosomal protein S4
VPTCCSLLESRLDNVVYRMGFGSTRAEARQLVSHKAVTVNGQVGQHPVVPGQGRRHDRRAREVQEAAARHRCAEAGAIHRPADWVQVDATKMEGVFKKVPDRDQFGAEIKEALIVELYSR